MLMRKYFYDVFNTMSLFLNEEIFMSLASIEADISQFLKLLSIQNLKQNEYFFTRKHCYYCHLCDFNPIEAVPDRIEYTKAYGQCLLHFNVYHPQNDNAATRAQIEINDLFFQHFRNIRVIHIENCNIISSDNINFDSLQSLEDLTLINTGLTELPGSIWNSHNLKKFYVCNEKIKSLIPKSPNEPKNIFQSLNKLTMLTFKMLPLYVNDFLGQSNFEHFTLPNSLKELNIDNLPLNTMPFAFENCVNTLTHLTFRLED